MKNFVLIGVGGYIAPRHLQAIKETGNNLLAALDKNDSVGILDSYFPDAHFFTEFERFDRHCEKLRHNGVKIDYVSVCSPNYLHDAHIRFGLRIGAHVICEKPIVLNPWNINALIEIEHETNCKVFSILQLRLHKSVIELKNRITQTITIDKYNIDLVYITSRGNWYHSSWKGDISKSGGIATNIGIHFFDMLIWIFGDVIENQIISSSKTKCKGKLLLQKASVNWFLSIDSKDLPLNKNKTHRSLYIDGNEFEFNDGFTELHTESYRNILNEKGFRIGETKASIQLVHEIRKFIS